ncbi:DEAD/DEAH box helicase, partial [Salmonella enterica subsp. enterica serovar Alachua]|nr:DEAD/DEAH box helicase [Salmonella enterica subsp. enterica serovar Alachua]
NERVDTVANFVTAHISTNLNFILVKYLTLWSNIISSFLNEEDKERYAYILNLPSMLEMGSYNPTVLEIMSFGINRSTAIELEKLYRKNKQSEVRFFLKNVKLGDLDALHQKYLTKAGFGVI